MTAACHGGRLADALLWIEGAPAARRVAALAQLDFWAEDIRGRLVDGASSVQSAACALREVLCDEAGLLGDADNYDAPENSLLTAVIERRLGEPVLLASIWLEVGRRAGVHVVGVGLPGHFIARVGADKGVYVDPFGGGATLSRRQCARIVATVSQGTLPWHDDYLAPASALEIAQRVLRNLMRARRIAGDGCGLYRAVRLYAALRPDDADAALVHARMAEEIGAARLAVSLYEGIVSRFGASREAMVAQRRLSPLRLLVAQLH